MKAKAILEDGALSLLLIAENEPEQRMIGAVLNQPRSEIADISHAELSAELTYLGHYTNRCVSSLKVTVKREG